MNPDYTPLYQYIEVQRHNGATDQTIYQSLQKAGWPDIAIQQALNTGAVLQSYDSAPVVTPLIATSLPQALTTPALEPKVGLFKGRIGRVGYLLAAVYVLLYYCFILIAVFFTVVATTGDDTSTHTTNVTLLILLLLIVALIPLPGVISAHIRRWHDMDQSGWLILLAFIPFVGFVTNIILLVVPGTAGANSYGPVPSKSLAPLHVFGFR